MGKGDREVLIEKAKFRLKKFDDHEIKEMSSTNPTIKHLRTDISLQRKIMRINYLSLRD
jgi:hypothetical protein